MKRKILSIEPRGGLCNRMRALESAVQLAKANEMTVRLIWRVEEAFGSRFNALFEPIPEIERVIHQYRYNSSPKDYIWLTGALGLWPWRPVLRQKNVVKLVREGADLSTCIGSRGLYLRTWSRFFPGTVRRGMFQPVPALQARIEAATGGKEYAIGVHIRHGDHAPSTRFSPTELFVERVAAEFEKDPEAKAILATDDPEAEKTFAAEFGDKVSIRPKTSLDRSRACGIEDAVVDLFCLARTRRILGSTASSFSRVAAELGDIPLEVVTNRTDEPLVW